MADTRANPQSIQLPGWAGPVGAGLGAAAGFFPTPSSGTTNTNQTTSGFSSANTDLSSAQQLQDLINSILQTISKTSGTTAAATTPTFSPEAQQFINGLITKFSGQTAPISADRLAGLQTQQINQNTQGQIANLNANMAARGLSTSPVAAASEAQAQAQRVAAINQAQATAPITANQLNLSNLLAGSSFMGALPRGVAQTGGYTQAQDTSQTGQTLQNQQQTSQAQTAQNNANYQNQTGNQNTNTKQGGGIGGAISGGLSTLVSMLPFILSDKRVKHDIESINSSVNKLIKLNPKSWKWNGSNESSEGFVAQDLKKVFPNLVKEEPNSKLLMVNYIGLIPHLVNAVKELSHGPTGS